MLVFDDNPTPAIIVLSLLLLLGAAAMMVWHVRTWRTAQRRETDAEELDYRRRQCRRRMQSTAMCGLLAIAWGAASPTLRWMDSAWFALAYVGGTLALVAWILLLALADMMATRRHFGRQLQRHLLEQSEIEAEARRLQADKSEGVKSTDRDGLRKEP